MLSPSDRPAWAAGYARAVGGGPSAEEVAARFKATVQVVSDNATARKRRHRRELRDTAQNQSGRPHEIASRNEARLSRLMKDFRISELEKQLRLSIADGLLMERIVKHYAPSLAHNAVVQDVAAAAATAATPPEEPIPPPPTTQKRTQGAQHPNAHATSPARRGRRPAAPADRAASSPGKRRRTR